MSIRSPTGESFQLQVTPRDGAEYSTFTLPTLDEVEKRAATLRPRYLAWIFDLGQTQIEGMRLIDHLQLRAGFSYWWMTPLVQKCNFDQSPWIDDAIKLMAQTDWAVTQPVKMVNLASTRRSLAERLKAWCAMAGIASEWLSVEKSAPDEKRFLRRVHKSLPAGLQGAVWLIRYLIERWPLRGVGVNAWRVSSARISFFSYFFNLTPVALTEKRFESRYWGYLPDVLHDQAAPTNWLHIYVKDTSIPTAREAAKILREFNKSAEGYQTHTALESFLSVRVVLTTLRDWLRIARSSRRMETYVAQTTSNGLNLWPLFAEEWRDATVGTMAIANLIYLNLFEEALKQLPHQRSGVYLQENQGWEFAMLQAWKAAGHGRIIGCPHSAVRYWDLRYFFDVRCYNRESPNPMPLPDNVAVNGSGALRSYLDGGYPAADLIEVEALRYLYLNDLRDDSDEDASELKPKLRLLVLGDYTVRHTKIQMHLLELAASSLPKGTVITVKPHPACPIHAADYPKLAMRVTMEPISKLLPHCDVAYTSSVTAAALDAFCAGVPVISVLDSDTLNQSPLRGMDGVKFVSTPVELSQSIAHAASQSRNSEQGRDFFHLDADLPRWRKLLVDSNTFSNQPHEKNDVAKSLS
jgi:surface carbohydrate biosynthesis protein (TIGR04326 family)